MKKAPQQNIKDQTATDYWLEKGDYVNFDYVTLGWNVPIEKVQKLKKYVRSLRLAFTVNNLATISGYSGLSPMINSSTVNSTLGVDDKRGYPLARTYTLGLSINFLMEEEMMKQYMKNKSLFLQKEELLSRIAELFSKKILRPSGVLVFLLITCLGLFSCSKFLEENPKDKLPEDDVYNTISEVYLNAVASLYTYVGGYSDSQGLQGTGRGVYDLNTFTSDEAIIPTRGGDWYDGGFWQGLYLHDWGIENDAIQATWEYLYKVVMLSNKSLERIDKFAETHSATELPAYRAEVRAMRAMYYYYLMDLFGRIPLVQSSSVAMKDVVQSERKTVFDFVVKELQEAAPLLSDAHSNQSGPYYGRITRPVVTFLLAKLALNSEVYTDNDWTDGQRPDGKNIKFTVNGSELNAWETVIYYCDQLKTMGYKLEPEYETNFYIQRTVRRECLHYPDE